LSKIVSSAELPKQDDDDDNDDDDDDGDRNSTAECSATRTQIFCVCQRLSKLQVL